MRSHREGRWYFGWNVVAAATLITLLTVGLRLGVGPFFIPLVQDLGISRGELGTIVAVGMLVYGLAAPLAGHLAQTRGARFTLLLGTAITVIALAWSVLTKSIPAFAIAFGPLLSVGLTLTSPVALTPLISRWFVRQRGKALFYLSTGSMAGIAVMTPVLTLGVEQIGWRATLVAFAVLFVILVVPASLLVIRENPPQGADGDGQAVVAAGSPVLAPLAGLGNLRAMRTSYFWKITAGLFACGFSMNLLGTQGVPMLVDHGFDPLVASLGIGLIGLVAIAGTVTLGQLADRVPRRTLLSLIYLIRALGFIGLLVAVQRWQLYAVAVVAGLVWAGSIALSSAILADLFGVRMVGVLYGWAYLGHQVGATISSWLGGWGYEQFGTHWVSFGAAALVLLMAGLVVLRLPTSFDQVPTPPSPARAAG